VRRDLVLVIAIAVAAFGIRTCPAWQAVFSPSGTRFLETDAWYHVRLTQNQVRNYPWRVTLDPYAAPDGQFVPIAPLFDTITASIVVALHGRAATSTQIERVAALMPPVYGAFTVIAVWALARRLFDRRAGLVAAALLAILPGHFMDRTMLGFVDHHALEALLAIGVLLGFSLGLTGVSRAPAFAAGAALGLYLLTWGSGAFLVAIVGAWLIASIAIARSTAEVMRAAMLSLVAALVALALVAAFQDPLMHRYDSQILALTGLAVLAGTVLLFTAVSRPSPSAPSKPAVVVAMILAVGLAAAATAMLVPGLLSDVLIDLRRLAPDASRMGVLEARPLFLYSGRWAWGQPWIFFRTGFFIGALALVPLAWRVWRFRGTADLLVLVFAVATFAATIGQNRFGYYLVTACAVLGGWLAVLLLDWAGVPHADDRTPVPHTRLPLAREVAVVAIAAGMFAPNLAPRVLLAERSAGYPDYWRATMRWLREQTPSPFTTAAGDYFLARYRDDVLRADYTVMSWWDQGYWITQQAQRVPVANPTQERAAVAGQFYSATDEAKAIAILKTERSQYVIADYELPFRRLADGTIMGRFQTIVDWTGAAHDPFYEVVYRRESGGWTPVWLFYEPYYRSMAFRLAVLGGTGATPTGLTLVTLVDRVDATGLRFREIAAEESFESHDTARHALAAAPAGSILAGLDPWRSAFPLEPLSAFSEVHAARTPEQKPGETPWVRVFEVP
jgi:dolichyl-diphosphooligosaccharide--protein glycosyltransferase